MAVQAFSARNVKNKNMKKFLSLICLTLILTSCIKDFSFKKKAAHYKSSTDFVQGSEDIPLLIGMDKMVEESLGFDSNSGSIINSSYETKLIPKYIKDFYLKTLPQMGWELIQNDRIKCIFKRDNEKLEIEFEEGEKKNIVRFFVSSTI